MNSFWNSKHSIEGYVHEDICLQLKSYLSKIELSGQVLDYGCGAGRVTKLSKDLGLQVVGYDFSEKAIETAKSLYSNIDFTSNFNELENKSFDSIVCHRVLHSNAHDVRKAICNKIIDLLKPNGTVFVSVRSLECEELIEVKSNINYISVENEDHSFLNLATKKYIHFFDDKELLGVFSSLNLEDLGHFFEKSGKKKKYNKYLYLVAKNVL